MGSESNPSLIAGRNYPVESVTWSDAQLFILNLNHKEATQRYRLPTEAEWDRSARAGTETLYFFGDVGDELGQFAWHRGDAGGTSRPVGEKAPNPWGLFDIYGNVAEWTEDYYADDYYAHGQATAPQGPGSGLRRVFRGGSWRDGFRRRRSAARRGALEDSRDGALGFRLAFTAAD
jgi:formylglycine-generating enzyme required for sulfatase activity